jgi:peroxiredoxin
MAVSEPNGDPAHEPESAHPTQEPAQGTRPRVSLLRLAAVLVIVGAIVGTTWVIGNRQGFGGIGEGGVNSNLIPSVGEMAPDLVTVDVNGNVVRLHDLRGQPVWLTFWGSWCPPCRAEFPDVEAAWQTLQPQGLVMLGVAVGESPLVAQDYADRVGGTFPILADPAYLAAVIPEDELPEARALVTSYTINNYPTHIFINRDGTVGAVVLSPMTYDQAVTNGEQIIASPMPADLPATPED